MENNNSLLEIKAHLILEALRSTEFSSNLDDKNPITLTDSTFKGKERKDLKKILIETIKKL